MAKSDQAKSVIEETPEFKAAVADAVNQAAGRIQKEILAKLSAGRDSGGDATGDQRFAEQVAMAIASLTDQGVGRRTVAPKILRQRAEARQLMTELIVEAKQKGFNGIVWQVLEWNEPAINFYKKYKASFDAEWINCSINF